MSERRVRSPSCDRPGPPLRLIPAVLSSLPTGSAWTALRCWWSWCRARSGWTWCCSPRSAGAAGYLPFLGLFRSWLLERVVATQVVRNQPRNSKVREVGRAERVQSYALYVSLRAPAQAAGVAELANAAGSKVKTEIAPGCVLRPLIVDLGAAGGA